MPDFHAELEYATRELELAEIALFNSSHKNASRVRTAARRARAALDRVGPTALEIIALIQEVDDAGLGRVDLVRRALIRWSHSAGQPVPFSERRPKQEDCDAEGQCWLWGAPLGGWIYRNPSDVHLGVTHWRPYQAFPIPGSEQDSDA